VTLGEASEQVQRSLFRAGTRSQALGGRVRCGGPVPSATKCDTMV
jgi:hypothetical protein